MSYKFSRCTKLFYNIHKWIWKNNLWLVFVLRMLQDIECLLDPYMHIVRSYSYVATRDAYTCVYILQ